MLYCNERNFGRLNIPALGLLARPVVAGLSQIRVEESGELDTNKGIRNQENLQLQNYIMILWFHLQVHCPMFLSH